MRSTTALAAVILAAALAPLPALADDPGPTIAVTGHGEVMAAPDTAYITSGVTTRGETAAAALEANSLAMQDILETLTAAGIAERDIQTSNFSVNPNYVYSDSRDEEGYTRPPRIDGYQVSNTVTVRVRDLDSLGAVLDRAVSVGANTINGISFTIDDPSELLDHARKSAFSDARAKAELYAEEAGVDLEGLYSITEISGATPPRPLAMEAQAFDRAAASVPIAQGELSFSINVQVVWELDSDD